MFKILLKLIFLFLSVWIILVAVVFNGVKIDTLSFGNININELYLKYDKKLILKLNIVSEDVNLTVDSILLPTFNISGNIANIELLKLKYHNDLEELITTSGYIELYNNTVNFHLNTASCKTTKISNSDITIDKNKLIIQLDTKTLLDESLLNILKAYKIDTYNIKQYTGNNTIFANLTIPFDQNPIKVKVKAKILNSLISYDDKEFNIDNLYIAMKDSNISLNGVVNDFKVSIAKKSENINLSIKNLKSKFLSTITDKITSENIIANLDIKGSMNDFNVAISINDKIDINTSITTKDNEYIFNDTNIIGDTLNIDYMDDNITININNSSIRIPIEENNESDFNISSLDLLPVQISLNNSILKYEDNNYSINNLKVNTNDENINLNGTLNDMNISLNKDSDNIKVLVENITSNFINSMTDKIIIKNAVSSINIEGSLDKFNTIVNIDNNAIKANIHIINTNNEYIVNDINIIGDKLIVDYMEDNITININNSSIRIPIEENNESDFNISSLDLLPVQISLNNSILKYEDNNYSINNLKVNTNDENINLNGTLNDMNISLNKDSDNIKVLVENITSNFINSMTDKIIIKNAVSSINIEGSLDKFNTIVNIDNNAIKANIHIINTNNEYIVNDINIIGDKLIVDYMEDNITININNSSIRIPIEENNESDFNISSLDLLTANVLFTSGIVKYEDNNYSISNLKVNTNDENISLTVLIDNTNISFDKKEDNISLYSANLQPSLVNKLINKTILKDGSLILNIQGDIKNIKGKIQFNKNTIKDVQLLNNLISFINTTPAIMNPLLALPTLFRMSETNFNLNGYYIKHGHIDFNYNTNSNYLKLNNIYTNSKMMDFKAKGYIDIKKDNININTDVIFMKDHSKFINHIPIVGYIITGDDGNFVTEVDIYGSLNDPKFETHTVKNASDGVINGLKRIITLPLLPFKDTNLTKEELEQHNNTVDSIINTNDN